MKKKTKAQLEQQIFDMKNEFHEVETSRDQYKHDSAMHKRWFEEEQKKLKAQGEELARITRKMDFLVLNARCALNILNGVHKDDNTAVILQRNIGEAAGHLQAAKNVINWDNGKPHHIGFDMARDDKLDAMAYIFRGEKR